MSPFSMNRFLFQHMNGIFDFVLPTPRGSDRGDVEIWGLLFFYSLHHENMVYHNYVKCNVLLVNTTVKYRT